MTMFIIIAAVIIAIAHIPRCHLCHKPLIWGRPMRVEWVIPYRKPDLAWWDREQRLQKDIVWVHKRCFYKP